MFIVQSNKFSELRPISRADCEQHKKILLDDDYDFAVFKWGERDFLLHPHVEPSKCRLLQDTEGEVAFYVPDNLHLHLQFPNYSRLDDIKRGLYPNITYSCLGWEPHGGTQRWLHKERPDIYTTKIESLGKNLPKRRLLFYGRKNISEIRLRQLERIAKEFTIIESIFDPERKSLLDALLENECFALLGTDGRSIGCHRDGEAMAAAVPFVRVSARKEGRFIFDPWESFYCLFEDQWEDVSKQYIADFQSGKMVHQLLITQNKLMCTFEKEPYFRVMESLVKGNHDFTRKMITAVSEDEMTYWESTEAFVKEVSASKNNKDALPKVSFVVPCMGRLNHLRRTVCSILTQPNAEYILVDWSCPEDCGKWVEGHYPLIKTVKIEGQKFFNLSKARNAGAKVATNEWLCFIDCDMVLSNHFCKSLAPLLKRGQFVIFNLQEAKPGYSGTTICHRDDFLAISGYDEKFEGWGREDDDFKRRLLRFGLNEALLPIDLAMHINHGNEDRIAFYECKDQGKTATINDTIARERDANITRRITETEKPLVGLWQAVHKNWAGTIHLLENGRFSGGQTKPDGIWFFDGKALVLSWYSWPVEKLILTNHGFTGNGFKTLIKTDEKLILNDKKQPISERVPSIIGRWEAKHVHWSGWMEFMSDGKITGSSQNPSGTWSFDGNRLNIRWDKWPVETLYFNGSEFVGNENFKSLKKDKMWDKDGITVDFIGRTGNNMFQYAYARCLAEQINVPYLFHNVPTELKNFNLKESSEQRRESYKQPPLGHPYYQTYANLDILLNNQEKIKGWFPCSEDGINLLEKLGFPPIFHVRGGDYQDQSWQIDAKYYSRAATICSNPLVVTDDIPYSRRLLKGIKYIDIVSTDKDFSTLYHSKKLVCSNSTYCWWAAFLGNHEHVYSPDGWQKTGRSTPFSWPRGKELGWKTL